MKLNYFRFKVLDWRTVAMLMLIFEPWLFKVSCVARPERDKESQMDFPETPEIMIGLADLDLEDIEIFVPPPLWEEIKDSITKIQWEQGGPDSTRNG